MKKNLLLKFLGIAVLAVVMNACGDPCDDVQPQDTRSFGEQVRSYMERDQKSEESKFEKGKYAAYFDLSDGMEFAFKVQGNEDNLADIVHTVTINKDEYDVYGLEANMINPMNGLSQTELFNRIIKTENTGIMAPIEKALEQIVQERKPSILVTDFEEYKDDKEMGATVIEPQAYAGRYFQDWMRNGGAIKFYIMDFVENNLKKKLFIVVFDDKDMKLVDNIDFAMGRRSNTYKEYVLQSSPYKVYTDYALGKGGNYIRPNGVDPLRMEYAPMEGWNMEAYDIKGTSWLYSIETLMGERVNPNFNFRGLLTGLYVDLSDTQSRNISKLGLKITDITDDFKSYTANEFAKQFMPKETEDEEDAEMSCDQQYFYDETGELRSQFEYKPSNPKDISSEEFLVINQEAFRQSFEKNPKKAEIIIDFNRLYTDSTQFKRTEDDSFVYGKRQQVQSLLNGRILKVDVCIAESDFEDYSALEELFGFESMISEKRGTRIIKEKEVNRCISESIIDLLRKGDLDPKGRVIYTYILKDSPQNDYSEEEED